MSHVAPKVFKHLNLRQETLQEYWSVYVAVPLGFHVWIPSILVELMPLNNSKFAVFKLCRTYLKKCLTYSHEPLQVCWSAYVIMHLGFRFWIHVLLAWLWPLT